MMLVWLMRTLLSMLGSWWWAPVVMDMLSVTSY